MSDHGLLQRLMELYVHDMSAFWELDLGDDGSFGVPVEPFLTDAARRAYLIEVNRMPAGFALVAPEARIEGAELWLEQFFVLKRYRGQGIGRRAAIELFNRLPAEWALGQWPSDGAARAFWRKTLLAYAGDSWREYWLQGAGPVQRFSSRPEAGQPVRPALTLQLDHADGLDAVML